MKSTTFTRLKPRSVFLQIGDILVCVEDCKGGNPLVRVVADRDVPIRRIPYEQVLTNEPPAG